MPIALPPPNLLELAGADAVAFAHAQFASDVRALAVGRWQWSAWLSAQGRVRALFRLLRVAEDRLLAVAERASTLALRDGLARYVLRSRVQLRADAAPAAAGYCEPEPPAIAVPRDDDAYAQGNGVVAIAVTGAGRRRWFAWGDGAALGACDASADAVERWRLADIQDGLVALDDAQSERYLPSWLGLERLGAVSVGKGCYPGQEIVARLHFRGGNKRWLHRLAFSAAELPAAGTQLQTRDGALRGEVVRAAWQQAPDGLALAVLPELAPGSELASESASASFRVVSSVRDASG